MLDLQVGGGALVWIVWILQFVLDSVGLWCVVGIVWILQSILDSGGL